MLDSPISGFVPSLPFQSVSSQLAVEAFTLATLYVPRLDEGLTLIFQIPNSNYNLAHYYSILPKNEKSLLLWRTFV